jgi:hypothetical protein
MQERDEIPVGVHIGSKGCRERYTNTRCPCPHGRCWVTEARACHGRGEPAPTTNVWLNEVAAEGMPPGAARSLLTSTKVRRALRGTP